MASIASKDNFRSSLSADLLQSLDELAVLEFTRNNSLSFFVLDNRNMLLGTHDDKCGLYGLVQVSL